MLRQIAAIAIDPWGAKAYRAASVGEDGGDLLGDEGAVVQRHAPQLYARHR